MKLEKLSVFDIAAIICAAVTILLNTIAYFFLPNTIVTQISFSSSGNHTSTLLYMILITVIISVSAAMTVFTEKKSKWIFIASILTVINIVLIIINLI